jgi:hypothetical protein
MNLQKYAPLVKYYPPNDPYYLRVARSLGDTYTDKGAFSLLYVDPNDIEYCSLREFDRWKRSGAVMDGDWDRRQLPFEEASFYTGVDAPFYKSMKAHFEEDVKWEETAFVREVLERVRSGHELWGGCRSEEDVRDRCEQLEALYENIAEEGYKSKFEYLREEPSGTNGTLGSKFRRFAFRNTVMSKDEVAVDIGRDGELLYFDGKHRFSIAKLLDVESIPVRVVVRHRRWQDVRDELRRTGTTDREELRSHPDLQDLLTENRGP